MEWFQQTLECVFLIKLDLLNVKKKVELKAEELNEKYKFTHVCYQAEQDILRAARLREFFGLGGQTFRNALAFRDKVLMKEEVEKAGLSVPPFSRVHSYSSILLHYKKFGLPLVAKPTCGMGAVDTFILRDEEDLKKLLLTPLSPSLDGPIDLEVENFASGEMYHHNPHSLLSKVFNFACFNFRYHCDGLIYNNTIKVMWVSKYVNTCVSFLKSKFLASYTLQMDNPLLPKINSFVKKTLEGLNRVDSQNNENLSYSFHVEVFYDHEKDSIVLCEAACRTGGAGVSDVIKYLFQVDLNKASVQVQCGDVPNSKAIPQGDFSTQMRSEDSKQCAGWLLIYPKVGKLLKLPNAENLPHIYSQNNSSRREFTQMAHCTDCLSQLIITGKDENEIIQNIHSTVNWFEENTVWG